MYRIVGVHRRRVFLRKRQYYEVRSIIDALNISAIIEYFERYIKIVMLKRRERGGKD